MPTTTRSSAPTSRSGLRRHGSPPLSTASTNSVTTRARKRALSATEAAVESKRKKTGAVEKVAEVPENDGKGQKGKGKGKKRTRYVRHRSRHVTADQYRKTAAIRAAEDVAAAAASPPAHLTR